MKAVKYNFTEKAMIEAVVCEKNKRAKGIRYRFRLGEKTFRFKIFLN